MRTAGHASGSSTRVKARQGESPERDQRHERDQGSGATAHALSSSQERHAFSRSPNEVSKTSSAAWSSRSAVGPLALATSA